MLESLIGNWLRHTESYLVTVVQYLRRLFMTISHNVMIRGTFWHVSINYTNCQKAERKVQQLRIWLELLKSFEANMEEAFCLAPSVLVPLNGFETERWNLVARIDLGAPMLQQGLWEKFRGPVLQSFKAHPRRIRLELISFRICWWHFSAFLWQCCPISEWLGFVCCFCILDALGRGNCKQKKLNKDPEAWKSNSKLPFPKFANSQKIKSFKLSV